MSQTRGFVCLDRKRDSQQPIGICFFDAEGKGQGHAVHPEVVGGLAELSVW